MVFWIEVYLNLNFYLCKSKAKLIMLRLNLRMEDKKLEARKKFLDPVRDRKEDREKFMIDLRKKNKNNIFKAKRLRRIQEQLDKTNQNESVKDSQTLFIERLTSIEPKLISQETDEEEIGKILKENIAQNDVYLEYIYRILPEKNEEMICIIYKYDLLKEITFYISSIIQNQKEGLLDIISKELFQQIKNNRLIEFLDFILKSILKIDESDSEVNQLIDDKAKVNLMTDLFSAFNNIGGSPKTRNELFKTCYIFAINSIIYSNKRIAPLKIIRMISWGIRNINCKEIDEEGCNNISTYLGDEADPEKSSKDHALQWIMNSIAILLNINDKVCRVDALEAICLMSDFEDIGNCSLTCGVVGSAIKCLTNPSSFGERISAINAIGGITSSNCDEAINELILNNILEELYLIINSCANINKDEEECSTVNEEIKSYDLKILK